jgi:hypothetical protein
MSDEYHAERAYAECDPLGLDAGAMRRDDDILEDARAMVIDEFDRRAVFYHDAIRKAFEDDWKAKTFGSLLSKADRLIEVARIVLEHGHLEAAEIVLKEAELDYQTMVDRIDDLRSDPLP